jgi:hypothetical protein
MIRSPKKVLILKIASVLTLLVGLVFFDARRTKNRGREHFARFDEATLNGELAAVRVAYKGVQIQLVGDTASYVFYPRTDEYMNHGAVFWHVAKPGDRLVKPAYSDTVLLISGEQQLRYLFSRIDAH